MKTSGFFNGEIIRQDVKEVCDFLSLLKMKGKRLTFDISLIMSIYRGKLYVGTAPHAVCVCVGGLYTADCFGFYFCHSSFCIKPL